MINPARITDTREKKLKYVFDEAVSFRDAATGERADNGRVDTIMRVFDAVDLWQHFTAIDVLCHHHALHLPTDKQVNRQTRRIYCCEGGSIFSIDCPVLCSSHSRNE